MWFPIFAKLRALKFVHVGSSFSVPLFLVLPLFLRALLRKFTYYIISLIHFHQCLKKKKDKQLAWGNDIQAKVFYSDVV